MGGNKLLEEKQTIYEAYSTVLHEWTEALSALGTSKHLPAVAFQLWVAYLQRVGVAFLPEDDWSSCFRSLTGEGSMPRRSLSPPHKLEKGIWSEAMFRKTQKGKTKLHYQGFSYCLSKSESGRESWWCEKKKSCPGCLLLLNWEIVSSIEHNHPPKSEDEPLLKSKTYKGALDSTLDSTNSHQLGKNEMTALTPSNTVYCCFGIETPSLTREIKKEEMSDTPSSVDSSQSQTCKRRKRDFNISLGSQKSRTLEDEEHEQPGGRSSDEDVTSTSGSDKEYLPYIKRNTKWYFRPRKSAGYNMQLHKCIRRERKDGVGLQDKEAKAHRQALHKDNYLWHSKRRRRILGKKHNNHEHKEKDKSKERDENSQDETSFDIKEDETSWTEYSREVDCRLKRKGNGKFEIDSHTKAERKKGQGCRTRNNTDIEEGSQEETYSEDGEMSWENDNEEENSSSWEENSKSSRDGLVWEKDNLQEERLVEKKDLRHKFNKKMSKRCKNKVSYDTFQQKHSTPKKWCQPHRFNRLLSIESFPYMMKVLLGLLYLAVLLAKEQILLMDIIRWCQEGLIPYLSSPYLMKSTLKSSTINIHMIRGLLHIPDSACVRKIAGELSIFLSLQSVPHPPIENVVVHLVKLLRLPDQTTTMAQEVVSVYEKKHRKNVLTVELPCVESLAMAALVLTLKMWCGIDNLTEHHLSTIATRLNAALRPSHYVAPLFSWDDWERYITRLLWFCRQVDPLCGLIYSTSEMADSTENRFLSELSQILTFCECAPTVHMTDMKKCTFISNMMDAKGHSLEKIFDCPRIVRASSDPFLGIVGQFIAQQTKNGNEKPQSPELLKMGHDLQQTSFASHQLFWPHSITNIQQDLEKCGSQIILYPVKYLKGRHSKVRSTLIKKRNKRSSGSESLMKELHYCLKDWSCLSSDCSSQSSDTEKSSDSSIHVDTNLVDSLSSSSEHVRGSGSGMYCSSRVSSCDSTDLEGDLCAKINTGSSSSHSPGDSSASESDIVDKIVNNGFSPRSDQLLVPLPLYSVWRLNSKKFKKKDFWKTLPRNYRWLITVGSLLCSVSKQQLLHDVNVLEKSLLHTSSL